MIMNTKARIITYKLFQACKQFVNASAQQPTKAAWIKPQGYDTNIKIYNSITRCKEPLILKNKDCLTWYMCGPTVYNSAHIGHAVAYVRFDILSKILRRHFNINVILVMGITDIDDKIIKRSMDTKENYLELTKRYEHEFFEDMNKLNVSKPYLNCRVTEYISQIIEFINNLITKGNAYAAKDGSVYFDTSKYDAYGKLCKPFPHEVHEFKKSTLDFALWKTAKQSEPAWDSPWGQGRPGWHIECSAIASAVFGNAIDIHSGGVDLKFPHHENEEAQSCSYHNVRQWVNYWVHSGHLYLKGDEKMSKSLNNTISISEYLSKYTADEFRMLCLLSHYRNGIEFSDDLMHHAVSSLKRIENFINDCNNYVTGKLNSGNIDETCLLEALSNTKSVIDAALANDFDTASSIHEILKLVHIGNTMLHKDKDFSSPRGVTAIASVSIYITTTLSNFGILENPIVDESCKLQDIVNTFITFRSTVRNESLRSEVKNNSLLRACDKVRTELSNYGITIKDYKQESTWCIKNR